MDPVEQEMARRGLSVGGAARPPVSDDPVEQEMARRGIALDEGPSFTEEATAVLSGPNATIANILGFPVDAANWLLRLVGLGDENPIGGAASIKSGMNTLGIATDRTPRTGVGRITKRVAEELTAAPLMMMGAGAVSRAANLGPTASAVMQSFTSNPGTQILASAGAGVGGGIAREIAPNSAGADMAGSMVGGVLGSALPSAARYAWDMGGAITAPFREEGRRAIVGRTLQRASGAGENLGLAVDDAFASGPAIIPGSNPTTAQLLRDDGLAATERGLRSDPKVAAQFSQRAANQAAARSEAINSGIPNTQGSAPAVKAAVEGRVQQFTEFADDIVNRTENEVRKRLAALGPNTDPEDAGRAIREAIQARRDALVQIRERATRPLYDAARAETAAVDPAPALGVIDDALRTAKGDIANALDRARGAQRSGHHFGPHVEVILRVADHGLLARGAARGVDAHHIPHRYGEHAVGVVVAQVLLGGEWEAGKVGQRFQILRMDARRVEFLPVGGDARIGVRQRPAHALDLQRDNFVAAGAFDRGGSRCGYGGAHGRLCSLETHHPSEPAGALV